LKSAKKGYSCERQTAPINLIQNGGSLPLQLTFAITLILSIENATTVKNDLDILE